MTTRCGRKLKKFCPVRIAESVGHIISNVHGTLYRHYQELVFSTDKVLYSRVLQNGLAFENNSQLCSKKQKQKHNQNTENQVIEPSFFGILFFFSCRGEEPLKVFCKFYFVLVFLYLHFVEVNTNRQWNIEPHVTIILYQLSHGLILFQLYAMIFPPQLLLLLPLLLQLQSYKFKEQIHPQQPSKENVFFTFLNSFSL